MSPHRNGPLFPIVDGNYKMPKEPIVRIGVVLAEDGKKQLEFVVPTEGYAVRGGPGVVGLAAGLFSVHVLPGGLEVRDGAGKGLSTGGILTIVPPKDAQAEKPGDGVLVKGVVAGRGFHWAKLIDQTLTDELEFSVMDGSLVMVNEIPIETYLIGVITGEMSGECPTEFMKAQAIAARSWLLGQPRSPHPGKPFNWCNDDCCQRYQGTGGWSPRAIEAIRECRGEVLITPSKRYCDARYSKSTGGISEDALSVWGELIEGLFAVPDAPKGDPAERFFPITEKNLDEYLEGPWLRQTGAFASPNVVPEGTIKRYLGRVDEVGEYFRWKVTLTQNSLRESLVKRGGIEDLATVLNLRPGTRGQSGRLESLLVDYAAVTGEKKTFTIKREYYIRAALSMKFLYSSAFKVTVTKDADGVLQEAHLVGAGWGHGAGLCQIGALGRAIKGQKYPEILSHYYQGVKLEQIYP